jgi:hypothetical protein
MSSSAGGDRLRGKAGLLGCGGPDARLGCAAGKEWAAELGCGAACAEGLLFFFYFYFLFKQANKFRIQTKIGIQTPKNNAPA